MHYLSFCSSNKRYPSTSVLDLDPLFFGLDPDSILALRPIKNLKYPVISSKKIIEIFIQVCSGPDGRNFATKWYKITVIHPLPPLKKTLLDLLENIFMIPVLHMRKWIDLFWMHDPPPIAINMLAYSGCKNPPPPHCHKQDITKFIECKFWHIYEKSNKIKYKMWCWLGWLHEDDLCRHEAAF